jgi:hypothetical protein
MPRQALVQSGIEMRSSSQILVDGGRFETQNTDAVISKDQTPVKIVVTNDGLFNVGLALVPGTIDIQAAFENNGGISEFAGNMRFAAYNQTQARSTSIFTLGQDAFSVPIHVTGGDTRLLAATLVWRNPSGDAVLFNFSNGLVEGSGRIGDLVRFDNSALALNGAFTFSSRVIFRRSNVSLAGYSLGATIIENQAASTINVQGGTLRANLIINNGVIRRQNGNIFAIAIRGNPLVE